MAKVAGKRYTLDIWDGRMFVEGQPVDGQIDHIDRRLIISGDVPLEDRADLADRMARMAELSLTNTSAAAVRFRTLRGARR